jgi:hypothetical protein
MKISIIDLLFEIGNEIVLNEKDEHDLDYMLVLRDILDLLELGN